MIGKRNVKALALSKKANVVSDSVVWVLVIVAFVMISLFTMYFTTTLNQELKDTNTFDAEKQAKLDNVVDRMPSFIDGVTLFIVIALWLAVIVASIFIDSHPVFMVIVVFVLVAMSLVGMALSNIWDDISNEDELASTTSTLPITNFIISNLPIYIIVLVVTVGVVLYAKWNN